MLRITLIILSLLIVIQTAFNGQVTIGLCYYLLFINIVTFFVYAFDKSAARKSHWRVKELTLHILSLVGGWWGALIAQQFLRHKSIKRSFLVVFALTLLLNISTLFIYKGSL
ncbi:MAG: DUF1294 domain-containing protein [Alteromonadales bacterium]|nr:DUF1294 domain-containing protein [Alteromonadales bacterium]